MGRFLGEDVGGCRDLKKMASAGLANKKAAVKRRPKRFLQGAT